MAQLSSEERIRRVEMAPLEIQNRVAKAFLRDDIDDEDVQYLFNTDTIEELNESLEECQVENINAEDPEGVGAGLFSIRTTKPSSNKNFITKGSGGWNTCIKGYPTDPDANALANCVGYASGRFNEIINIIREIMGCTYTTLNCNAENFIERAQKAGLEIGSTPRIGAIMCWQKGTLSSKDGAGHVAIVEKIYDNNHVYTSESGYGGKAFWNQHRYNNNGRWGLSAGYTFRAFIYLPNDVQKVVDGIIESVTPNVEKDTNKDQIEVLISDLRVRKEPNLNGQIIGMASKGFYNYSESTTQDGYSWYKIADTQWIAANDNWTKLYPKIEPVPTPIPEPTPTPAPVDTLKVGDTVKIIGTGNGSSYGTSNTAYGIGWTRQILKIWDGRKFPYQVGNSKGTTGFYQASELQKK